MQNCMLDSKISNMALMTVEISADPKFLETINLGPNHNFVVTRNN